MFLFSTADRIGSIDKNIGIGEIWDMNYMPKLIIFWIMLAMAITATKAQEIQGWENLTLPSDINRPNSLAITPNLVLAGELDSRLWLNPHNGVYASNDLGKTWQSMGLTKRGISDIAYTEGIIYAATYYKSEGTSGLFKSTDEGRLFSHVGPSYASAKVAAYKNNVYLGTYSHGLWVSNDAGATWVQQFGDGSGVTGEEILEVQTQNDIVLAATKSKTYISSDKGNSWDEIAALNDKNIANIHIDGNIIFAGSKTSAGLYVSVDTGKNWENLVSWGSFPAGVITKLGNTYYVGIKNAQDNTYTLLTTNDMGATWQSTNLTTGSSITSAHSLLAIEQYLYTISPIGGLNRLKQAASPLQLNQFLSAPWEQKRPTNIITYLTSFFDHEYPLLGYKGLAEPEKTKATVTNFLGITGKSPNMYYSSHNGIDFGLPIGTKVTAAASGKASYYTCAACGHAIKINHENGYQTVYMHLQGEGLITTKPSDVIAVNTGDVIGKVGMTGNTSGPHLHFGVLQDKNNNGLFDDFPDGQVDPFSWMSNNIDPWEVFSWKDNVGTHTGSKSKYLWTELFQPLVEHISKNLQQIAISQNISVNFDLNEKEHFTVKASSYAKPNTNTSQKDLAYVVGTSFIINLYDQLYESITQPSKPTKITIDLSELALEDVIQTSLKLYYLDENTLLWQPLPTIIDAVENKLISWTNHFSTFAVFGNKVDEIYPKTTLYITGETIGNWYVSKPNVEVHTTKPTDIVYINKDTSTDLWEVYAQPFNWYQEGINRILFRAQSLNGNIEEIQEQMIKTNTSGAPTDNLKITNINFNT